MSYVSKDVVKQPFLLLSLLIRPESIAPLFFDERRRVDVECTDVVVQSCRRVVRVVLAIAATRRCKVRTDTVAHFVSVADS